MNLTIEYKPNKTDEENNEIPGTGLTDFGILYLRISCFPWHHQSDTVRRAEFVVGRQARHHRLFDEKLHEYPIYHSRPMAWPLPFTSRSPCRQNTPSGFTGSRWSTVQQPFCPSRTMCTESHFPAYRDVPAKPPMCAERDTD